jgi:hypothetical protein
MPVRYLDSVYCQPIQLKAANVYTNDTSVPVCISGFDVQQIISNAYRLDGLDIVVTDVNGNLIPRYIASFNRALGIIQLWYKDPAVSTISGGTQLYLQCGGSSVNVPNDSTVWASNYGGAINHALVVHGEDVAANLTDASGNYTATDANLTYAQTGALRLCPSFNGNNSSVDFGNITQLNAVTKFTLNFWVMQTALAADDFFFTKNAGADFIQFSSSAGSLLFFYFFSAADYSLLLSAAALSAGVFSNLSIVYDGTQISNDTRLKLFSNKTPVFMAFAGTIPAISPNMAASFILGQSAFALNGKFDEFNIIGGALSDNQISGQYDNQNGYDTNSTITIGAFSSLSSGYYKYW